MRKPSNPLMPQYKLQSVEHVPQEPNKFIRDQILVDDIEGARPYISPPKPARDIMNIKDIEGT